MKQKRIFGYLRCSTSEQSTDSQRQELEMYAERRGWAIDGFFEDKAVSGATNNRPQLNALMDACRRRQINVVIVQRLDRWGRSLQHLVTSLQELRELDIEFLSVHEALDTTTTAGRMLFQLIAVFAEYERNLIAERTRIGVAAARRRGQRLGRPPKRILGAEEVQQLRVDRRRNETPFRVLAKRFGTSVWTAHRLCTPAKG